MNSASEILSQLKVLGTEQARKTYRRHGVVGEIYGVSYSDFGKFQKKLKTDHALALGLWATGVHDAKILALMIGDPQKAEADLLDSWVATLDCYVITDAFSVFAAKTPSAQEKAEAWMESKQEWISSAGWNVMAHLAMSNAELPDSYFELKLNLVEKSLGQAPNRTRHEMNNAVICIGTRNPGLQELAVATAKRYGKVVVNHGDTGCKTPDAVSYIQKVVDHKAKKAGKTTSSP